MVSRVYRRLRLYYRSQYGATLRKGAMICEGNAVGPTALAPSSADGLHYLACNNLIIVLQVLTVSRGVGHANNLSYEAFKIYCR